RDAAGEERAEALPGDAFERDVQRVLGEAFVALPARDDARKHRADRAMRVADLEREPHRLALLDRPRGGFEQSMIERARKTMVLRLAVVPCHLDRHRRLMEHPRKIESLRLPVRDALA